MDGIYSGKEMMELEKLLKLPTGTELQVGLEFRGKLEKLEHVIWTPDVDIWRVYFQNGDPVVSVDASRREIKLVEESDGTPVC